MNRIAALKGMTIATCDVGMMTIGLASVHISCDATDAVSCELCYNIFAQFQRILKIEHII